MHTSSIQQVTINALCIASDLNNVIIMKYLLYNEVYEMFVTTVFSHLHGLPTYVHPVAMPLQVIDAQTIMIIKYDR